MKEDSRHTQTKSRIIACVVKVVAAILLGMVIVTCFGLFQEDTSNNLSNESIIIAN